MENMTMQEIEERIAELDKTVPEMNSTEEIEKATEERKALVERAKELKDLEERQRMANDIANGNADAKIIEIGGAKMSEERTFSLDSAEYRMAYLKKLAGKELTQEERAAITTASSVPYVQMQEGIIAKAKEYAPIIADITVVPAKGYVKFAVEGVSADAEDHTEGATITAASDTLVEVELTPKEITKLVQISESVATMSVDGLEAFLIENLAKALAAKIENKIVTAMSDAATSVATGISNTNVLTLFGALKGGYGETAKVLVTRKTLYTEVINLQDKSKNDMVTFEDGVYKLLGTPIETTPSLSDGEMVLGDTSKFVAALAEDINVKVGEDLDTNSRKYLGVALFDGKVAVAEAFQKISAQ